MPTPGELLARKLNGDTTVTNNDIAAATDKFFSAQGVDVHCVIVPKERKDADIVTTIVKERHATE
jgi:hypothetical protein